MKYICIICIYLGLLSINFISACSTAPEANTSYAITVTHLLKNKTKLDGKNVKVVGYFSTHFDGSTLRDSSENHSSSVLVSYCGTDPTIIENGKSIGFRKWDKWQGTPVILKGEFSISAYMHMGRTLVTSMIEPIVITKIDKATVEKISAAGSTATHRKSE